jgi:hypothetical protein
MAQARRPQITALAVAIDTGQHDLVRLLLAFGYRPDLESRSPFDRVLQARRYDLLDLLFEAGADPTTADPDHVFGTYSREVMERFWALGVDLAGDGVMAGALAGNTRNRPLYGFVKNHIDDPRIQREADLGLGYAIGRKSDKAVSLCIWAGANPRHSVPVIGDGYTNSDDWTMTAFERAVWEGVPEYLTKLGFDSRSDDIEPLYEVAYHAPEVEALAMIRPPRDWHSIAERFLDRVTVPIHLAASVQWGTKSDLERVLRLGGRLRTLSDLVIRRLRKHLKGLERDQAKRLLRLLEKHTEPAAFLHLVGHPMFIEDYKNWGLKRKLIEELADRRTGSGPGSAKARRVLKAEDDRPPKIRVPSNKAGYVRVTRDELYEIVWSTSVLKLSKGYGLSHNGLSKIRKKLDVPTPPRGYWAGERTRKRRTRLPPTKDGWPIEAWLLHPRPQ